ncbi:MAG: aldose 1-epimerase family protein [Cellulosilyticaceae bacterium]
MYFYLKNNFLTATFKSVGAELCSIKDSSETEFIWNADPAYWGRHTPILFPLVGKVIDNQYTHDGKTYSLGQHGFARDQEFEVTHETSDSLTFTLRSNEKTLSLYPFSFELDIVYTLTNNTLSIQYVVRNLENETITFKIGAHPGFMCPLLSGESLEDYYFEFNENENATLMPLTPTGYFTGEKEPFKGNIIPLTKSLFEKDALVFTDLKSTKISLKSKTNKHSVTMDFSGFPFLALWAPVPPAPFVCIEPWFGHADTIGECSDISSKKDVVYLDAKNTFTCTHKLTFR